MNPEDLTPDQRKRLHDGCCYELSKMVSIILLGSILLISGYPNHSLRLLMLFIGVLTVSQWIIKWLFPHNPLEELRKEIEELNDLS